MAHGHGVSNETGLSPVDRPGERYYDCMPFYHGTGGINAMWQMLAGTTLCVAPRFSVRGFWPDVRESRATWFVYVGETLRYLLAVPADEAADRCHAVHSIYGNGLRPDVWQRFRDRFGIQRIHEFFNSTEAVFALDNVCRGPFLRHAVGHHGALLRLRYHGLYVPVAVDSDTGDIVRDLATGFACRMPYHLGVSTAEVAQVLGNFPGILEANVYGVELPGHDGKAGAAAISIDRQQTAHFSHQAFLEHARKHLPRYAVPVFIRHLQQVSTTHNKKQNKTPLKAEGIHPDKLTAGDEMLWIDGHGKGITYVPFTRDDWNSLQAGEAKL